MNISNLGFLNQQFQTNNTNFQGRFPKIKPINTKIDTSKGTLLSIAAFAELLGISTYFIKKGIENDEIELTGKKIDPNSEKNKNFATNKIEELRNVSQKPQEQVTTTPITTTETEKKTLPKSQLHVTTTPRAKTELFRSQVAKLLGVNQHSINWHIKKGHLILNENQNIDITEPTNKAFIDGFKKLSRWTNSNNTTSKTEYTVDEYPQLQEQLGKLPLEYCLQHQILIADESGTINLGEEKNKHFLELIENKTISHKNYFLSIGEFAKLAGVSLSTILRALMKKEIVRDSKLGIDINHPQNAAFIKNRNEKHTQKPELKTAKEVADMLGYTDGGGIKYYVRLGKLITDKNGLINIYEEPNKTFLMELRNNKKTRNYAARIKKNKVKVLKEGKYATQSSIAKELGMAQSTLAYHILQGHLNFVKGKGINIVDDPKNIQFLETFKRGDVYQPKETDVKPQNKAIKNVDFNLVWKSEFAKMLNLGSSTILHFIERGQIVQDANGKIDLNNPKNIEFINKYETRARESFQNLATIEVEVAKVNLKTFLKNRISAELYDVSENLFTDSIDKLKSYLEYRLKNIVNTEELTQAQYDELYNLFEDIVLEELEYKPLPNNKYFKSEKKVSLHTYKYLLETINDRKNGNYVKKEVPLAAKATEDDFEIVNDIIETKSFQNYVNLLKQMLGYKIELINRLKNTDKEDLVNAYLYNNFLFFKTKPYDFYISKDLNKPVDTVSSYKATNIVEKVLFNYNNVRNSDKAEFEEWKQKINIKNIEDLLNKTIQTYKETLDEEIFRQHAYEMLLEDNDISVDQFKEHLLQRLGVN